MQYQYALPLLIAGAVMILINFKWIILLAIGSAVILKMATPIDSTSHDVRYSMV